MSFFFFFQAEDGIRDSSVTGVQTCALPICKAGHAGGRRDPRRRRRLADAPGPTMIEDVAIRTRALTKRYGDVEAVRGVDLDVRAGEIFGLIGPDGAGKTSTFQILGGVMRATAGTADLLGQPARQARAY